MSAPMRNVILLNLQNRRKYFYDAVKLSGHRKCSTDLTVNHNISLDPDIMVKIQDNTISNPKKHPGIVNIKAPQLPSKLLKAVNNLIEKYPTPDVKSKSEELTRYLWSRKLPTEDHVISELSQQLKAKYISEENYNLNDLSQEESTKEAEKIQNKVLQTLRYHIYHWKPVNYDAYKSMLYMVGRLSSDYTVLYRIFSEIAARDPAFRPKTMFDFGSGVGSAMWAVNSIWEDKVYEHYCVDSSGDMNTVARMLLQGGEEENEMCFPGVYFRQFFPASQAKFDLVVSAFTLLEQPNQEDRLRTLYQLWQKTENYLVLVDNGTYAGYSLISEARDYILQLSEHSIEDAHLKSHVFAPCPHDKLCPRGLRKDKTPCNFEVKYNLLKVQKKKNEKAVTRFSYVVLKKGERDPSVAAWPRVVRPPSTPSKRVHCRTCAANGELQVSILTPSRHGKELFRCAKACKWGDLLPVVSLDDTEIGLNKENTRNNTETESQDKNSDNWNKEGILSYTSEDEFISDNTDNSTEDSKLNVTDSTLTMNGYPS